PLNSIYFPSDNIGYIAGDCGTVLRTTDKGNTWVIQYSGTSNNLYGIYFANDTTGYTVGSGVTILKTIHGGGDQPQQNIPETIVSNYNISVYPNPFKQSVWIKYEINDKSKVVLKIFDLSGKQITTLINTTQPKGIYKIRYNASRIPAGVYLLVAQINNKLHSEKMILIKP
ncbi:MAG: T9SS type A sorting domain-containing protein, partial [Bacteroidales bacterium]|nr:T9SS type A sorting domain-containing protein [Bacteroidales bacterium]